MYKNIHVQCINPPELQFGSFITIRNGFGFLDNPSWVQTDSATQNGCFNKENFQRICYFQSIKDENNFDKKSYNIGAENCHSARQILNVQFRCLKMMYVTFLMMSPHNYSKLMRFTLRICWSE